jgi:hypothetical protein
MLNKKPVFVCGFTRGGTNILMNFLLSHPDLCKPTGETAQVFRGRREEPFWRIVQRRLCYDAPIRLLSGQDLFNPHCYQERSSISPVVARFIDWVLDREKRWARTEAQNRFRYENVEYSMDEVASARLLSKNVNGVVFLTDVLNGMYDDVTFFGLVRDGRALCESHLRRGASVDEVAQLYEQVGEAMQTYAGQLPNFHLVRFEEVITNPMDQVSRVYQHAGLDPADVPKFRLQIKAKTEKEGERKLEAEHDRQVVWYDRTSVETYFDPAVNDHQINQLDPAARREFEQHTEATLRSLGYSV